MKLYLVRHGESLGNLAEIYLGHADWDLSKRGEEQARLCAKALLGIHFDKIYSSDLLRAYNTARPHAELRGMEITSRRELREIYLGDWEERKLSELRLDEAYIHGWKECFGTFSVPGGESVAGAAERVFEALRNIAEENPTATVLVTMHAAVIRAFWCKISGFPPSEWAARVPFPENASYSVVEYKNGVFTPLLYSCSEHLKYEENKA